MTMDYLDDLDRCAGCGAVEPPQRVTLDDDLCDTFGVAGPGVACERCAEIARDRKARGALEALCLRHGCEWALDLVPVRPVVILHRGGAIIGRAAGDTLADAVNAGGDLTLDLSEVTDFDSAGVQLLLAARRSLVERGQRLHVAAASQVVRDGLQVFGLQSLLDH